MPILNAIVAMSENRVIAKDGHIPWRLPEDFRWFKHKTMGATLIMGRKTREAIGRQLPGRTNLVLSRSASTSFPESKSYSDIGQLLADLDPASTAWVIGGAQIYEQLLPQCRFLYLTRVKRKAEGDTFFPPFEDQFELNQVVHENDDFRVERWLNLQFEGAPPRPEPWPEKE